MSRNGLEPASGMLKFVIPAKAEIQPVFRLAGGKDFMPLIQLLSRYFSRATRLRGDNYALSHRVEILEGSESSVEAEVSGSQAYFVSLELNEDTMFADCDCSYSEGGEACKHVWVTLVAPEKQGYLGAACGVEGRLDILGGGRLGSPDLLRPVGRASRARSTPSRTNHIFR